MADAANPNQVWGPNEYPHLDGSGLAPAIGITLEPGTGNTVNRARIVKTLNTSTNSGNQAHPLGDQGSSGY